MPTEPYRILLVEDDAGLVELLGDGLQRQGYRVDSVGSGRKCLAWVATNAVDLLILDYSLPDMNGAALIEELRGVGKLCPFLVTTGHGDEGVAVQLMKLGALDYLVKDVHLLDRLPGVVARVFKEIATERRLAESEEALRESEQRYRRLVASVTGYVYSIRIEGGRAVSTSYGPGCAVVTGYTPEDYAAKPFLWLEMVHPDDRAAVQEYAQASNKGHLGAPIENRILHKNGSLRWVQNTMVPRHNAAGKLVACDGMITDITARKQAEAALRKQEVQMRLFVENAPAAIAMFDKEMRYVAASNRWLADYGLSGEGLIGRSHYEVFPEMSAEWKEVHRRCLAGAVEHAEEDPFRRADGSVQWLRWEVRPWMDSSDSVGGIIILSEDISARRQAQALQTRYQLISQYARDPLLLVGLDGQIIEANQAAVDLYGYSRVELLGLNLTALRGSEAPEVIRLQMERALAEGILFESEHVRKDGTKLPVEVSSRGVVIEGKEMLLSVVRDITERKQAELELRESEAKLRAIFESSRDAIGVSKNGVHILANPAYLRLFGFTSNDEIFGKSIVDSIAPSHRQQVIENFSNRNAGKPVPRFYEARGLRVDGTEFDSEVSVSTYALGGEVYSLASIRDITERKKAEAALVRNEAELAAIYDHAPVMMLLISQDLKVRRLNQAALEFSGKTPQESLGLCPGDLLGCIHALDDPRGCGFGMDCGNCALRRQVLDTMQAGIACQRSETAYRFVRNHEVIDMTLLASTAQVKIGGEAIVLLCLEDVSQQKQAELRVREQAALLDVTQDAIFVLDLDETVTYWNRAAERIYGWTVVEAVGRKLTALFPDVTEGESAMMRRETSEHKVWSGEVRRVDRTGKVLIIQRRANLLRDPDGEPRGFLLVETNITEAKRVEEQFLRAQRLDSLGSLAGGVAHDLNNVFTPIMMSIEMLGALTREAHDKEMVQLLGDSTRRGADIVRQLLLFSRGTNSPREEVNVTLVVRELRRMMAETFPKSISISTQAPTDLWPVHGDQTQLHQVLLNLCVNARDAMPQGGRLKVTAENVHVDEDFAALQFEARPGPYVFLRVSDSGTGIQPEIIDKIFDPFFTTKPIGQGTGLGLSAALGIVRSHRGFVTVKSQPGSGSEFGVYLPAKISTGGKESGGAASEPPGGRGELVLVVDDEPSIRAMLERTLKKFGYQVACVADGREAVAFIGAHGDEVQLVITDVMMPNMGGVQLVHTLRQDRPQMPFLAISGMQGHRADFEKMPQPRIRNLAKPFSIDALLVAVREAIENAAAPAAVKNPDEGR